uniref:Uncharacterized protein n=1 Tax=Amphimedon queenslandica TaxID=400682 RepID=A0A1X7VVW1_AMPQE
SLNLLRSLLPLRPSTLVPSERHYFIINKHHCTSCCYLSV